MLTPHALDVQRTWNDGGVEVISFRYAPESWEVLGYSRSLSSDETVRLGAAVVTPLYVLAARRAIGRLLRERDYDLLHAHWVVPNGLVASPYAKKIPLAVGLHGSDVFMAEKGAVRPFVRRALAQTTLLTGCSPELVERVCALGFPTERAAVIPYGVDTETFTPGNGSSGVWRERLGIPVGAPVILSVGRMVTKKGYQVLVEIVPELLSRHPDAHLVLAGGGDRLEEFRQACAAFSERVHFPGVVFRNSLPELYRDVDVFVLPAVHDRKGNVDGLPNVILEAMASGLPIVASEISGIPLAVKDGVNGRLVPEGKTGPLLDGLSELLAQPAIRRRMGVEARERAEREHTWRVISGRYRDAYLSQARGS